ncbi:MAG: serine/threonine-protein kinase, partial [Polyangiaceae bacterium]
MTIEEKPTRPADGPESVGETSPVMEESPTVQRGEAAPPQAAGVAGFDVVVRSSLLTVGDKVDHYEVREVLGAGSMAEVYRARDTRLGRKVALKLVKPGLWRDDANAVARFLTEARLTAKFSHPHIVQVYAVGEHEGTPFLALEYLRGQNLRERLRERGRFPAREAARIGLAIAEALTEANRHGVLHRDLKPSNVLVPPDGRVRVLDFGIAWQTHEPFPMSMRGPHSAAPSSPRLSARAKSTRAAVTVSPSEASSLPSLHAGHGTASEGTPRYMAPEQWAGAELDGAID